MLETFKGFLRLRLLGFLVMGVVVGAVFGIRSLARGSDVVGVALIAGVLVLAVGIGLLVARRPGRRPR